MNFFCIRVVIVLISRFLRSYSAWKFVLLIENFIWFFPETAMGVSKKTQDKSGYEYAMAVMK